jgi:hypothetical protein
MKSTEPSSSSKNSVRVKKKSSYEIPVSSYETKISSCETKISWDEKFVSNGEIFFETLCLIFFLISVDILGLIS